jgi:hypothetical protein
MSKGVVKRVNKDASKGLDRGLIDAETFFFLPDFAIATNSLAG